MEEENEVMEIREEGTLIQEGINLEAIKEEWALVGIDLEEVRVMEKEIRVEEVFLKADKEGTFLEVGKEGARVMEEIKEMGDDKKIKEIEVVGIISLEEAGKGVEIVMITDMVREGILEIGNLLEGNYRGLINK